MNDLTPRFLFRRFFAFAIDALMVTALTALLMLPMVRNNTDNIRLSSGGIAYKKCAPSKTGPKELFELVAPQTPVAFTVCQTKIWGVDNGLSVKILLSKNETKNGAVKTRTGSSITVPVDNLGNPVTPLMPQGTLNVLFLIIGGAFLLKRFNGQTLGKKLFGIRVVGTGCIICREFRKYILIFIATMITLLASYVHQFTGHGYFLENFAQVIGVAIIIFAIFFYYYIWTFVVWAGQARWDRATGYKVVKA